MALPRKGLRSLTVDGVAYRYAVSPARDEGGSSCINTHYMERPSVITITLERAAAPGSFFQWRYGYEPDYEPHPAITPERPLRNEWIPLCYGIG